MLESSNGACTACMFVEFIEHKLTELVSIEIYAFYNIREFIQVGHGEVAAARPQQLQPSRPESSL